MATTFVWYELITSDPRPPAEAFYKTVVGWSTAPFGSGDFSLYRVERRGPWGRWPDDHPGGRQTRGRSRCGWAISMRPTSTRRPGASGRRKRPSRAQRHSRCRALRRRRRSAGRRLHAACAARTRAAAAANGRAGPYRLAGTLRRRLEGRLRLLFEPVRLGQGQAMDMGPMGTYQLSIDGAQSGGADGQAGGHPDADVDILLQRGRHRVRRPSRWRRAVVAQRPHGSARRQLDRAVHGPRGAVFALAGPKG